MLIQSKMEANRLITQIDAILPQTQCAKCGYPGCKPYATAIVNGEADINQCPPGGDTGIRILANLTHMEYKPLNAENGIEKSKALAFIDEATCIGCTLCIQACPVDAILGASKQMHTVITNECTGCELCLAPCPVDCITMQPIETVSDNWQLNYFSIANNKTKVAADLARKRYEFRMFRLEREEAESAQKHADRAMRNKAESAKMPTAQTENNSSMVNNAKKAAIAAAIERAHLLKAATAKN
ncbi:electron transport complex subunit RsxB [Methylotenera versatilis]|uniref:electron transport complex subunit RsxB n=1 Tax=Methylotenera versatilis TaxID=1055487 RepID=UPI00064919B2|nr:electron transport complex subunit RsxB [Methylotenera versatilis]